MQPPDEAPERLEWNEDWARFREWEYFYTGGMWTQALVVRFAAPLNEERGTFSFDVNISDAAKVSGSANDVAETIADIGYMGSIAYRLVDSIAVPGLIWGSWDVALQMTMIDIEGFGVAAFLLWNAQWVFGRERPMYRECPNPSRPVNCSEDGDDRYRAFIAGHTLITTTAAALTCVHHAHLPLYGGGAGDDAACGTMIGVAAVVGVARIIKQQHYATDTLLAWGIGVLAGYVVPSAMHYGFGGGREPAPAAQRRSDPEAVRWVVAPGAGTSITGATVAGMF